MVFVGHYIHFYILVLQPLSRSVCLCKLPCKKGQSGPTYESLQAVFDLQAFRPAVNLSNPTIANISFTLYAVLGVVSGRNPLRLFRMRNVSNLNSNFNPNLALFLFSIFQNEKTQILSTFLWLRLVSSNEGHVFKAL